MIMNKPIEPETVSEEKAEPGVVDWPEQETVKELPADRTTAPDITDTGYIWDQTLPGETQPMPEPGPAVLMANRVTVVSDYVLFGSAELAANTLPFQLVPAHRDRLRVTITAVIATGEPALYIGSDRNLNPGVNGWQLISGQALTLETRDGIYCMSGDSGDGTARIQWAAELVAE